jgi:glycerol kinase
VTAILALDQGTTGSVALVFDEEGRVRGSADREIAQHYPASGHVEHDAEEIFATTVAVGREALAAAGLTAHDVAAIGITNQRETTVVWERATGRAIHPAVVWQSRASTEICERLRAAGWEERVRQRTGLVIDPYFSGPKVRWILDQVPGAQARALAGELLCGTIESWLVWKLTSGRAHISDVSNAARTMVFDIRRGAWDDELLAALELPRAMLPSPVACSGVVAETAPEHFGAAIPIAGLAGDQQAALFGQTCFDTGEAKNTYGTGCFMLMNTGTKVVPSKSGLLTTLGYKIGNKPAVYALEGSIAITGALVQWLRDNLGMITRSEEVEALAKTVDDNGGVYFVPAFSGLFAPYWRSEARGVIAGLTRYVNKGHIARATLEATAWQTREVLDAMNADSGVELTALKVDGGMVFNELLMQFQSDVLGVPVIRPKVAETTALGAAYAAGLAVGFWAEVEDLRANWAKDKEWTPALDESVREKEYRFWKKAVTRTFDWVEAEERVPVHA